MVLWLKVILLMEIIDIEVNYFTLQVFYDGIDVKVSERDDKSIRNPIR